MITTHSPIDANGSAPRDEAFIRLVEQMRQYFSLADFLPVGEDAICPMSELSVRGRTTPVSSRSC